MKKRLLLINLTVLLFITLNIYAQDLKTKYISEKQKDSALKEFINYTKDQLQKGYMYDYHLYNFYGGEKVLYKSEIKSSKTKKSGKKGNGTNASSKTTGDLNILLSKLDEVLVNENTQKDFFSYLAKISGYKYEYLSFIIRPDFNNMEEYFSDRISPDLADYLTNYILQNFKEEPLMDPDNQIIDAVSFMDAEEKPVFPGGEQGVITFVMQNVTYPKIAKEWGMQGSVFVKFVIDRNGKVKHVEVRSGVNPVLDIETIRIFLDMPDWTPGKQKGKTVPVTYIVPVNFKLS